MITNENSWSLGPALLEAPGLNPNKSRDPIAISIPVPTPGSPSLPPSDHTRTRATTANSHPICRLPATYSAHKLVGIAVLSDPPPSRPAICPLTATAPSRPHPNSFPPPTPALPQSTFSFTPTPWFTGPYKISHSAFKFRTIPMWRRFPNLRVPKQTLPARTPASAQPPSHNSPHFSFTTRHCFTGLYRISHSPKHFPPRKLSARPQPRKNPCPQRSTTLPPHAPSEVPTFHLHPGSKTHPPQISSLTHFSFAVTVPPRSLIPTPEALLTAPRISPPISRTTWHLPPRTLDHSLVMSAWALVIPHPTLVIPNSPLVIPFPPFPNSPNPAQNPRLHSPNPRLPFALFLTDPICRNRGVCYFARFESERIWNFCSIFVMAVRIRLKRIGTKNTPVFRVVVADNRSPRDGKFIEEIGTYQPLKKDNNFSVNLERAEHWIKNGAQPSETVASFIKKARKTAAAAPKA